VVHGDCIEVMRGMDEASVDSIVTDPPYGLGFMGKAWDDLPPGVEWATECLRVLKPGGYMLAFGGTRTWHRLAVAVEDAGFEIRDSIAWLHGQGFPKGAAGLKPAHEPIVVARKRPSAPRTGILQIDACRIDAASPVQASASKGDPFGPGRYPIGEGRLYSASGRWPANVVLDETQAHTLDAQSGILHSQDPRTRYRAQDPAWSPSGTPRGDHGVRTQSTGADKGGASRFYYVAKASTKERPVVNGVAHATVKPLTLMRWLVRLVTPPGGTILDPFAGSGTTVEAAIQEGFAVIGIERDAEYLPLIDARITRNDPTLDLGDGGAA
jgi:hypothetical protein